MKKFIALVLAILTLSAICIPSAMALSGGYDAASEYLSTSTLKPGYGTVRAVTNLQYMLKALNCDPGTIDGIYGENTEAAVRQFQRKYNDIHGAGSLDVDGQCGRYTKIAIWEELPELPSGCY